MVDVLSSDLIMFASYYPYWNCEWPESTKLLRTRTESATRRA